MNTFASLGVILKNGASKRATSSLRKCAPLVFSYFELLFTLSGKKGFVLTQPLLEGLGWK